MDHTDDSRMRLGEMVARNNVIVERYRQGDTLQEIGEDYGVSKQRVFQIVKRGPVEVAPHEPPEVIPPVDTEEPARPDEENAPPGLLCPTCNSTETTVVDTRVTAGGVRRRRECDQGHRYSTKETVVQYGSSKSLPRGWSDEAWGAIDQALAT